MTRRGLVNVTKLREQGLPESLIEDYMRAVDAAWLEVAHEVRGFGSRPSMWLALQDPDHDRETVIVSVGIGAKFGRVSAKNAEGLRIAVVQHLRERFVPPSASS